MIPLTALVGQMVKCLPTMRETWVQSLRWEGLLEKEMATHSSILPGKSQGRRSLVGYSPWGRKESDTTEQFHFHVHNHLHFQLSLSTMGISETLLVHRLANQSLKSPPGILNPQFFRPQNQTSPKV